MSSLGVNPASPILSSILVTLSVGSGMRSGGDAAVGCGLPCQNLMRGPAQFTVATAPAKWILTKRSEQAQGDKAYVHLQITVGNINELQSHRFCSVDGGFEPFIRVELKLFVIEF
jgi:hypothetical protein